MPRKLKDQKMGEIKDEHLGLAVDLMMDRNARPIKFFALFNGERIEDTVSTQVESKVRDAFRAASNLKWERVISVQPLNPFHYDGDRYNCSYIGFRIYRFVAAVRADGKVLRHNWIEGWVDEQYTETLSHNYIIGGAEVMWRDRNAGAWKLPTSNNSSTRGFEHYLPYSDELWEGLNQMIKAIHELRERLDAMLGSPEGNAYIARIGAGLLAQLGVPALPAGITEESAG
jgi:hypothetical protein